jgi:Co/Zn/Cd efflux system component
VIAEACYRLEGTVPPRVFGGLMLGVSIVSIVIQGACFAMLLPFDGQDDDKLNLRSALLHLASDLTLGVAVIIASALVYFLNWRHADDWASIVCCVIFIYMCARKICSKIFQRTFFYRNVSNALFLLFASPPPPPPAGLLR